MVDDVVLLVDVVGGTVDVVVDVVGGFNAVQLV